MGLGRASGCGRKPLTDVDLGCTNGTCSALDRGRIDAMVNLLSEDSGPLVLPSLGRHWRHMSSLRVETVAQRPLWTAAADDGRMRRVFSDQTPTAPEYRALRGERE